MKTHMGKRTVEKTVPSLFRHVVDLYPERVALKTVEREVTYRDLDIRSDKIAGAILERLGPGSMPVVIFSDKDLIDSVASALGILKTGKFFVYVNPSYAGVLLGKILQETGAKLVITDKDSLETASTFVETNRSLLPLDEIGPSVSGERIDIAVSPASRPAFFSPPGRPANPKAPNGVTNSGSINAGSKRKTTFELRSC